jgi:uncharacterized membrane protein
MMHLTKKASRILHDIFLAGITIKGINGILELLAGLAIFFVKPEIILAIVQKLFESELIHEPNDFAVTYMLHASQSLTVATLLFVSAYLIIHGSVKIVLVSLLWLKKLWAYPLAGVILSIFVIYQVVRFFHTHSIILLLFTLVDVIILSLLGFEYRRVLNYCGLKPAGLR